MGRRKRRLNMGVRPVIGLAGTSIALGLSSRAVSGLGGNTRGLTAASSFLPVAGSVIGAGLVLEQVAKFKTRKRRR